MIDQFSPDTRAIRHFGRHLSARDPVTALQQITGINRRKIERLHSGKARLWPSLAAELADACTDPTIAAELRAIAHEVPHA